MATVEVAKPHYTSPLPYPSGRPFSHASPSIKAGIIESLWHLPLCPDTRATSSFVPAAPPISLADRPENYDYSCKSSLPGVKKYLH